MKRVSILAVSVFLGFLASCAGISVDNAVNDGNGSVVNPNAAWTVVWRDDFNGTALDSSKWTCDIGTGNQGWGNWELQYYRAENVKVSGGTLQITAKKENYGGMAYTSGRITTWNKWTFTFGKIKARIKVPTGKGLWPAFWMLGSWGTWPSNGEIDIMETIGGNTTYATTHWMTSSGAHASYGLSKTFDTSAYHVFEVQWDASYIRTYIDGVKYYEINVTPADLAELRSGNYFVLLNLAVGGTWPGAPDASTVFPKVMYVDYLEVQQYK